MAKLGFISGDTKVPIQWVIGLLVGCASFTGGAFTLGAYFNSRDAKASNLEDRVSALEKSDHDKGTVLMRVDRRLFRLELKQGVKIPERDMLPEEE